MPKGTSLSHFVGSLSRGSSNRIGPKTLKSRLLLRSNIGILTSVNTASNTPVPPAKNRLNRFSISPINFQLYFINLLCTMSIVNALFLDIGNRRKWIWLVGVEMERRNPPQHRRSSGQRESLPLSRVGPPSPCPHLPPAPTPSPSPSPPSPLTAIFTSRPIPPSERLWIPVSVRAVNCEREDY